MMKVIQSLKQS